MTKPADPDVLERLIASIAAGIDCTACSPCPQRGLTRSGDLAGARWRSAS
jgi:hypothetical protein